MSGVLEICINNIWNRVCVDNFVQNTAKVACRQMGFSGDNDAQFDITPRDEADTSPLSANIPRSCNTGNEAKLSDCKPNFNINDCQASGFNVVLECAPQGE